MTESMRQQAARLAEEVEASGIKTWHAKVNFVFLFAANLTGVYGVRELRKALGGEQPETGAEGLFHEFARNVSAAGADSGKKDVTDGC